VAKRYPFKVGDLVTTRYYQDQDKIVRKIVYIKRDNEYGSGFCASADVGKPCPHCNRPFADAIFHVDSDWFVKVKP